MNSQNLTPWKPGQSGNHKGKPKGSRHISTSIREMLDDDNFKFKDVGGTVTRCVPLEAIVSTLIIKAIGGDMRAIELICKYAMPQASLTLSPDEANRIRYEAQMDVQRTLYEL